ncbi:MAG: hypothetical protein ACLFNI_10685 [Natronomonas sp.]
MSVLQVPGAPELLVIALILLVLVGIVYALFRLLQWVAESPDRDRVETLERRVAELEDRIEADEDNET